MSMGGRGKAKGEGGKKENKFKDFSMLAQIPDKFMDTIVEMEFKGFDAEAIYTEVVKRTGTMDDRERNQLVFNLLIYFVKRGSNVSKAAIDKSGPVAASYVMEYVNALGITTRVKDAKGSGLTLPRLAAAFPHIVFFLYVIQQGRIIGKYEGETMPACFAYPGSPSIMTTGEWAAYKDDYLNHMLTVHTIINAKNKSEKEKSSEQVLQEQENYARIMLTSPLNGALLDDRRAWVEDMVKKYNTISGKEKVTPPKKI